MTHIDPSQELGLPANYDEHHIPSLTDLQRAARNALDYWRAFVLTHDESTSDVAAHLEEIAGIALAASSIKGDHQRQAIRLGLSLKLRHWLAARTLHKWPDVILPLLKIALEIHAHDLQYELYQAWGIYLYSASKQAAASTALEKALEYAEDTGREDLKLLARAERYNAAVMGMDLAAAKQDAGAILKEAAALQFDYVQGRVYLSLARACHKAAGRVETYMYAQQATIFFERANVAGFAATSLMFMIGSLLMQAGHSLSLRARLMAALEGLAERDLSPKLHASVYYYRAEAEYHDGNVKAVRAYARRAWIAYRRLEDGVNLAVVLHLLGMNETRARRWIAAERLLKTAMRLYEKHDAHVSALQASNALAWLWVEKGEYERGISALEHLLQAAESLGDDARGNLRDVIEHDLEAARVRQRESAGQTV